MAKEFWKIMCNELNYKLYTGTPLNTFKSLFETMDSEMMHYIPTINETNALGILGGAYLTGMSGGIFMQSKAFDTILAQYKGFNVRFNTPVLFIVDGLLNPLNLKQFKLSDGLDCLYKIKDYLSLNDSKSCILIIDEENSND